MGGRVLGFGAPNWSRKGISSCGWIDGWIEVSLMAIHLRDVAG